MFDPSEFTTLICRYDKGVLTVTLNRPARLNAFNRDMFLEVARVAERASMNPDVRVVLFKGTGPTFSSGGDLSELSAGRAAISEDSFEQMIKEAQKTFDMVEAIPKPTIAAINGHAVGAGLQLALACDFRIAVKGAKLGLSDVKIGIIPALGATIRLPKLIGLAKSKELILYGDLISSEQALEIGLVNRVVEKNDFEHAAQMLAGELMARAPLALSAAKNLLNSEASPDSVAASQARLFKTSDAKEGITAFLEKRRPTFTGS